MTPKVGMCFKHARVLKADTDEPAEYVVTRVADGVVYYKQRDERKAKECTPVCVFHKVVKGGMK